MIVPTGLKVFRKGEWKVKKRDKEHRRTWRKLHLTVDASMYEVIYADMLVNNVTDADAFPELIRQIYQMIRLLGGWYLRHSEVSR